MSQKTGVTNTNACKHSVLNPESLNCSSLVGALVRRHLVLSTAIIAPSNGGGPGEPRTVSCAHLPLWVQHLGLVADDELLALVEELLDRIKAGLEAIGGKRVPGTVHK
jgi:hypothetical protein